MTDSSDLSPNQLVPRFAEEFRQLEPDDQELVMAVLYRLRRTSTDESSAFARDVPFMEFDE